MTITYCYMQKLFAATLIVLRESKSRLSAARVAWRSNFVKLFNLVVEVDIIAELFQKFVDYAHTLHAFKI